MHTNLVWIRLSTVHTHSMLKLITLGYFTDLQFVLHVCMYVYVMMSDHITMAKSLISLTSVSLEQTGGEYVFCSPF